MSEEAQNGDDSLKPKLSGKISVKRTVYYGLIFACIIAAISVSFGLGYFAGYTNNDYTRDSDLEKLLDEKQNNDPVLSMNNQPMLGSSEAPISIIEFSDFECPFCAKFHNETLPPLIENYIDTGKVNFVFRDFPLDRIHPNARPAHIAAQCAHMQGEFWPYHDTLFEKQTLWKKLDSESLKVELLEYADDLSLDMSKFVMCLDDKTTSDNINFDISEGITSGVTGTPAFLIGNEKTGYTLVSGALPFDSFVKIIHQKQN